MAGSLGLVVPAYRPDVDALRDYVDELRSTIAPTVIRVELDDPEPETLGGLETLTDDETVVIATAPERRGKGAAITHGFQGLETEVLAFADADGSTPASSVEDVIDPVRVGRAALSVGSRRHPEATVRGHQTLVRRRLGDAFAFVAGRLLDVSLTDYQCGVKAIARPAWEDVRYHLYERGFAWDVELIAIAAARGHRIVEVPIVWEDQPGSTVSPIRTTLGMGRGLLAARHRARLIGGDPLHGAVDAWRDGRTPLVPRPDGTDE